MFLGREAGNVGLVSPFSLWHTGNENEKRLPSLTSLSKVNFPPINSTKRLQMAKPNPVPPNFLEIEASAWTNALNNLDCPSTLIPIPVSDTENISIESFCSTTSVTLPLSVNFIALLKRFRST